MKVLFCCSEAYPLIKTGGLGDVAGALPRALLQQNIQVRILLPAYQAALIEAKKNGLKLMTELQVDQQQVRIWQTRLTGSRVPVWLVDHACFSGRKGGPYCDEQGNDWPDNAWRYYLYSKVAEYIACHPTEMNWRPDIVHCNDWQTGLIPAFLSLHEHRPRTVFTIHNLAYRGLFSEATFRSLQLPDHWWHYQALEFWGEFSYLKAGLVFSDKITTVSPSYAKEIQTPEFGCGMEGVLQQRQKDLSGIVNGIDVKEWNPGTDRYLHQPFNRRTVNKKALNKQFLQNEMGLAQEADTLLLGFVGRLVEQKGLSILLPALEALLPGQKIQFVALGSGQTGFEAALQALSVKFPTQVSVTIGYDEGVAHRIEAGADVFLMPSLFEPCGLNQMYSQGYATLPLCHYVGGLRDTVMNLNDSQVEAYLQGKLNVDDIDETGFLFCRPTSQALLDTLKKVLLCYQQKPLWQKMQNNGMKQDFSWKASCAGYLKIYQQLLTNGDSLASPH